MTFCALHFLFNLIVFAATFLANLQGKGLKPRNKIINNTEIKEDKKTPLLFLSLLSSCFFCISHTLHRFASITFLFLWLVHSRFIN